MRREDLALAEFPVVLIPVDAIDVPETRLRSLKPAKAAAIGTLIVADGQYDPITVAQLPGSARFTLVDGLHRLEGCRGEGIALIEARIGSADREARIKQEILSAWGRADEDVFDRAAQVDAMATLAREITDNARNIADEGDHDACANLIMRLAPASAGNRASLSPAMQLKDEAEAASAMMALALNWPEATAETLGISRPQVFRHLQVRRAFDAGDIAFLRIAGLADQLMPLVALAKLPPAVRGAALASLEAGTAATIADAITLATGRAPDPVAKAQDNVLRKMAGWHQSQRAQFIRALTTAYDRHGNPRAA